MVTWRGAENSFNSIAALSIPKIFFTCRRVGVKAMKIKKQLTNKNRQGGARDEHRDRKIVSIILNFERMKCVEEMTQKC
jgi:hypothetical protein